MAKIDQLREQIDRIDDQLLKLINRRCELAINIGREKLKQNAVKHFHVPHRERDIIERLQKQNTGAFPPEAVDAVFREIFSHTLALEKPLSVAYLGPETTYSHQAAVKQFGHGALTEPCQNIEGIFQAVEQDQVGYGVVPIENSIEGVVNLTLDCFVESTDKILIVDEINLRISHCFLSQSGDLSQVKKIYSHPQALAQCRRWLNLHASGIKQFPVSSTAMAADMASKDPKAAAIASRIAAEFYTLETIAMKIEDRSDNHTRFYVIGKEAAKKSRQNKTSVMFSIQDESGSLIKALNSFARNKINLTKIQSRPLRKRPWEYLFFIDFLGHIDEPPIQKVIANLRKKCLMLRVMGSYPKRD